MTSSIPDIHYVDGVYLNYNGRDPDKPLTEKYAKRLINAQKKYGNIDTKTASGHGNLYQKRAGLRKIHEHKDVYEVEKGIYETNDVGYKDFMDKIKSGQIDTRNLKTRFRAGFRPYDEDEEGNELSSYTSVTYAKSYEGIVGIDKFIKQLTVRNHDVFKPNTRGGFKYVIYDKKTKKVYHEINYGEPD